MPAIHVKVDGDHERTGREVGTDRMPVLHTTADWTVDALEHGMKSGATSLMVFIPVYVEGAGNCLVASEVSLKLWMQTATVLAAKFQDEVEQPGWAVLSPAARALLAPRFVEGLRRVFTDAPVEQLNEAAELVLDGFGAGAPPEYFDQP